ncbi:MAG: GatB/YqeY domain-containing protein [Thermoleophilaceae bacterium]|nr:GatB/YqeY domain-containing protein [Thermoleophilaceae bacterium]
MSIAEQLRADTVKALKEGDRELSGALRMLTSELQKAEKEGGADEVAVLQRERKRRLESAKAFRDGDRAELAEQEEREAELIDGYLPEQISDGELDQLVDDAIAESAAESIRDMGKVMAIVMAKSAGRAEGSRVSALVKERLS